MKKKRRKKKKGNTNLLRANSFAVVFVTELWNSVENHRGKDGTLLF